MHILLVHQYFLGRNDAGGSRWNQFAKYWAAAGHEVTVLAGTVHYAKGVKEPQYKGRFAVREAESPGVTVWRASMSRWAIRPAPESPYRSNISSISRIAWSARRATSWRRATSTSR